MLLDLFSPVLGADGEEEVVVARLRPDPKEVLSEAEQKLLGVLRDHGPVLPLHDIDRLCRRRGVRAVNLPRLLGQCPFVTRVGSGLYGLVRNQTNDLVARATTPGHGLLGHGPTSHCWGGYS